MKPVILLLVAAATIGAAPSRPARSRAPAPEPRYEAGGFEPFWSLVIDGGWLTYTPNQGDDQPQIRVRVPPRQPTHNGYRYIVSPRLTIDVHHVRCEDYGSRTFADTVYVTGVEEGACGGRPIAPARLSSTTWAVGWLNGVPIRRGGSNFLFAYNNVVTGSVGCSSFSVPFTERRPYVQFGRMTVSRSDCPSVPGALGAKGERRVLEIFSGRSRISFVDGDTLILTGRHGTARLNPD